MKKWRRDHKMTQRDLAALLGIVNQEVSNYECGRTTPSLPRAVEIHRVTGIPCDAWTTLPPVAVAKAG